MVGVINYRPLRWPWIRNIWELARLVVGSRIDWESWVCITLATTASLPSGDPESASQQRRETQKRQWSLPRKEMRALALLRQEAKMWQRLTWWFVIRQRHQGIVTWLCEQDFSVTFVDVMLLLLVHWGRVSLKMYYPKHINIAYSGQLCHVPYELNIEL